MTIVLTGVAVTLTVMATVFDPFPDFWSGLLMEVASRTKPFPLAFVLVYVVGFVLAVVIGSIAWYNSKRPPGWEETERPTIVPEVKIDTESQATGPTEEQSTERS